MPQPADYLGAFVILSMVAIFGCGAAVVVLIAMFDYIRTQHKRRQLRNARR